MSTAITPIDREPGVDAWEYRGIVCVVRHVLSPGGRPLPIGPKGEPANGWDCGYVRLPKGHPWEGRHGDQIPSDAFGGITFSAVDREGHTWIGWDGLHPYEPDRDSSREETEHLAREVLAVWRSIP